jgi:anti-sigma-K factor RskA
MHSPVNDETAGLYALGLLDGQELAEFERHLDRCEECRRQVGADREAIAHLDAALPSRVPPARLRSRVIATAALEMVADEPPALRLLPIRPESGGHARVRVMAALAAGVVLLLALGFLLGQHFANEQVLATVPMQGPAGQASVLLLRRSGGAEVALRGLPDPPVGQVYQAWVVAPTGIRVPAGTYDEGDGDFPLTADALGRRVELTVERAPGAEIPTGEPLLWTGGWP